MSIAESIADGATISRTAAWLPDFPRGGADDDGENDSATSGDVLARASFTDVVGIIEQSAGSIDGSATIRLYQAWISHQEPGAAFVFAAWFNLGVAYSQAGDKKNAILAFQNSLALRPDFHAAATNLGLALESVGQTDAALRTWASALQSDEVRTGLINHRARLLEQTGRLDEAEQEMRRSLAIDPDQPDVIQHWVHVRQKMCQWPVLTDAIPGLPAGRLMRHIGPLSALSLTDDIQVQREVAAGWIQRKTYLPPHGLCPPKGYSHERLRIGYISSDYCRHAMSYLIAELFERHDRERFEIYGYCLSPDDGSDIRARVISSFDHFKSVKHLSDEQAARLIREDEIDILVDLNGLTSGARLQILRWRPAPVQATYLGFIGPVPLPELDYMFCDDYVVPVELSACYAPSPLTIAQNYQVNDSKRAIGKATTRAAAGLPDDRFVFCCFSNYYKITDDMFTAWMTILRRSPNSVLWLVSDNEWARRNLLDRARALGVDPNRLIFASRVGADDYMARLPLADLFLDTFPYNAGTIASDAIRMGLPLLTLSGRSFASRMASRLLAAAGASQGITTTVEDYIETAVSLATNASSIETYRAVFNADTWRRQIGDIAGFTELYENTLRAIARRG